MVTIHVILLTLLKLATACSVTFEGKLKLSLSPSLLSLFVLEDFKQQLVAACPMLHTATPFCLLHSDCCVSVGTSHLD